MRLPLAKANESELQGGEPLAAIHEDISLSWKVNSIFCLRFGVKNRKASSMKGLFGSDFAGIGLLAPTEYAVAGSFHYVAARTFAPF